MDTSFERGLIRSDEWYTPKEIIQKLGEFDLDPCAPCRKFYTAKTCYDRFDDGLSQDWFGRVWLNPPYKKPIIVRFFERMAEHDNGIALVFNRMDTKLWHDVIFPTAKAMLIIRGRLKFVGINGIPADCAGCGSVLVAFGMQNAECLKKCNIDGKFIRL